MNEDEGLLLKYLNSPIIMNPSVYVITGECARLCSLECRGPEESGIIRMEISSIFCSRTTSRVEERTLASGIKPV